MAIFTEETQQKILTVAQEAKTYLKILANGWKVKDWKAVQMLVQMGAGPSFFPVGTQLNVASTQYGTLVFDVVAHDHHKNPNDASAHTMTLLQHYVIYGQPFDSSELTWVNTTDSALAAGVYNFIGDHCTCIGGTEEDGSYQFTSPVDIPAGGGWRHNKLGEARESYSPETICTGTITIYDAENNILASDITVTVGSEGTNLGTVSRYASYTKDVLGRFNSTHRSRYGSGNWAESGIRQRLNATGAKGTWWKKQTVFDTPWTYANSQNGFLYDIDPEFLAVLGEVDNVSIRDNFFEADGILNESYTTRDKAFLLSLDELGFKGVSNIPEGSVLDYYENATDTDRIKYDISNQSTACYWWTRSRSSWIKHSLNPVYARGTSSYGNAIDGRGIAPACVIY